jgi:hypothetical protein
VTRRNSAADIPMSRPVRGPAIARRRISAVRPCRTLPNSLWVSKLEAPKMPRPAKKTCRTTSPTQMKASQP